MLPLTFSDPADYDRIPADAKVCATPKDDYSSREYLDVVTNPS